MTGDEEDPRAEQWAAAGREFLARLRLGRPVVGHGTLPGGQHWSVAYGVTEFGPVADLFVAFAAGGGMATGVGRYISEDGSPIGGSSTGARSNDHRILCWMTLDDVDHVALETGGHGELVAALVHTDDRQGVRVFLAVVEDRNVALRAAHFRDHQHRPVRVEDLASGQSDFESWLADPRAYLAARGVGPRAAGPDDQDEGT